MNFNQTNTISNSDVNYNKPINIELSKSNASSYEPVISPSLDGIFATILILSPIWKLFGKRFKADHIIHVISGGEETLPIKLGYLLSGLPNYVMIISFFIGSFGGFPHKKF